MKDRPSDPPLLPYAPLERRRRFFERHPILWIVIWVNIWGATIFGSLLFVKGVLSLFQDVGPLFMFGKPVETPQQRFIWILVTFIIAAAGWLGWIFTRGRI